MQGSTCGFLGADACNTTTGKCFAPSPFPVSCLLFEPGCACDGSEISIACTGLPTGYFSKPLRHDGACATDIDSGAVDSGRDSGIGATCSATKPCALGEVCGYAGVGVCSDTGSCYPGDLPVCDLYLAGCACDGTAVNTACTGLPTDVYAKPLSHAGACKDGG
jgi:hypothetical protein